MRERYREVGRIFNLCSSSLFSPLALTLYAHSLRIFSDRMGPRSETRSASVVPCNSLLFVCPVCWHCIIQFKLIFSLWWTVVLLLLFVSLFSTEWGWLSILFFCLFGLFGQSPSLSQVFVPSLSVLEPRPTKQRYLADPGMALFRTTVIFTTPRC